MLTMRRPTLSLLFFNDTPTPEIYTLSLHDALPIFPRPSGRTKTATTCPCFRSTGNPAQSVVPGSSTSTVSVDRKSTRLNSSHANISYAVFCLKKNKYHVCRLVLY